MWCGIFPDPKRSRNRLINPTERHVGSSRHRKYPTGEKKEKTMNRLECGTLDTGETLDDPYSRFLLKFMLEWCAVI